MVVLLSLSAPVPVRVADAGIDWPAWISAGAAMLTLIIVGFTAGFALVGLWDARRTRHAQLITEIMRAWTDPAAVEAHALHGKFTEQDIISLVDRVFAPGNTAAPNDLSDWSKLTRVANLIESLGVLVSEAAITPEVVYKMWGGAILTAWPKWDKAVTKLREYDGEPDTFVYFEEISLAIRGISEDRRQARASAGTT